MQSLIASFFRFSILCSECLVKIFYFSVLRELNKTFYLASKLLLNFN